MQTGAVAGVAESRVRAGTRSPVSGAPPARRRAVAVALALTCLALAALSLVIPGAASYDPWAWLVWGREVRS